MSLTPLANHLCHVVEGEALGAADGEVLVVVLPGGEQEQLAALAGFHALAAGLGEVSEVSNLKFIAFCPLTISTTFYHYCLPAPASAGWQSGLA